MIPSPTSATTSLTSISIPLPSWSSPVLLSHFFPVARLLDGSDSQGLDSEKGHSGQFLCITYATTGVSPSVTSSWTRFPVYRRLLPTARHHLPRLCRQMKLISQILAHSVDNGPQIKVSEMRDRHVLSFQMNSASTLGIVSRSTKFKRRS